MPLALKMPRQRPSLKQWFQYITPLNAAGFYPVAKRHYYRKEDIRRLVGEPGPSLLAKLLRPLYYPAA